MAAVAIQLVSTSAPAGVLYGLQPSLLLVSGGAGPPPTVTYYDMRGWDTTQDVYWTSTGSPDLFPAVTVPAAVGTISNKQIIGVR